LFSFLAIACLLSVPSFSDTHTHNLLPDFLLLCKVVVKTLLRECRFQASSSSLSTINPTLSSPFDYLNVRLLGVARIDPVFFCFVSRSYRGCHL
jgi:hypothetical protein